MPWGQLFSLDAARSMGRFVAEFFPPDLTVPLLVKMAQEA